MDWIYDCYIEFKIIRWKYVRKILSKLFLVEM